MAYRPYPSISLNKPGPIRWQVVNNVKKTIARLQKELPAGTIIDIVQDSSIVIRDSVRDVQETMILGGILNHPDRFLLSQFLAFHGDHRSDPAYFRHFFFYCHELLRHDHQRHDLDGLVVWPSAY